MSEKRRDNKGRVLKDGESQRKNGTYDYRYTDIHKKRRCIYVILSRLVDTFISRISLTMLPVPKPHNTACVLSWEEARRWQSRSSGYSSS